MKRIFLNVSVLQSWDVPDDFTEDEAQAMVDDFMEAASLNLICNDVEWDMLPIDEKGLVKYGN